ncbi:MAG: efflux RND transporter periplasmic adaptor subunit [Magnetococcales bacterium]|nr:efflux RND transporter periplasmic adaptor subunit [Magnetococcales bacterium]
MRYLYFFLVVISSFFSPLHAEESTEALPVQVTVSPVDELLFHPKGHAPATVVALRDALVSAEISGIAQTVLVEVGQQVEAGTPLVQLDGWDFDKQIQQVKAERKVLLARRTLASRQLAREQKLKKVGQSSAERRDMRTTDVETLTAEMERLDAARSALKVRLKKCTIRAPFAGVIAERVINPGMWVSPGVGLVRLVNVLDLALSARLSASQSKQVQGATDLQFQADDMRYPVAFEHIVPVMDSRTRTLEMRFAFTGQKPQPGTSGRLLWHDPQPHLPAWALVYQDGQAGVMTIDENTAKFNPVGDLQQGKPVPKPEGLSGMVILDGRQGLKNGDVVQIALDRE